MARAKYAAKVVEVVGDVNVPEYDGGFIIERSAAGQKDFWGDYELEWVVVPDEEWGFDAKAARKARWEVYRVTLDPEIPNWGNIQDVARSGGQDPTELAQAFVSPNPRDRAYAYMTWAGHYGWHEFDSYPLSLTLHEVEKRYNVELPKP